MGAITRLAAMPGTNRLPPLLALLFVLAALSGCGSDEIGGEIPQANAEELNASLEAVRAAVETSPPQCTTAESNADQFVDEVNGLPADAGTELKTALRDAGENLRVLVDEQCASTGTTGPSGREPTSSSTTSSHTTTTSSTTDTTTTSSTEETQPPGNGNRGGSNGGGPPGGGPPGGGGTDGGTGGTGGGTGDETGD
jgi:hypothetical protein